MNEKPCKCRTVQLHGEKWACMLCGKEFIPVDAKVSNLERMIREDFTPVGNIPSRVNGSGTG